MAYREVVILPALSVRDEACVDWHPGGRHLLVSLALHLVVLAWACWALPPLAVPDDESREPLRLLTQELVRPIFVDRCEGEEEPPKVATRAMALELLRPDERRYDEEPEPAGGEEASLGLVHSLRRRHEMPAHRRRVRALGLLDVARRRPVASEDWLRRASWHVVVRGESLSSIARRYGFASHLDLYNDRLNPELVARRPDPDRIVPGDRVRLPFEG